MLRLIVLLVGLAASTARAAEPIPEQMLYLPLPVAPDPEAGRTEASITLHEFELPDARRAQIVRLEGWIPIGSHQMARLAIDYAGLESRELFRYGGGRFDVQWAAHYEGAWPAPLGLDLSLTVPVGDASLHPLSAKAPALRSRLRARVAEIGASKLWIGLWSRAVSPPTNSVREAPRGAFPSATGLDATLRVRTGPWMFQAAARHPLLGGAPVETTFHVTLARRVTESLAVRLGGATSIGVETRRMFDHMASFALVWTPAVNRAGGDRTRAEGGLEGGLDGGRERP